MSDVSSTNMLGTPPQPTDLLSDFDIVNSITSFAKEIHAGTIDNKSEGPNIVKVGEFKFEFNPSFPPGVICIITTKLPEESFNRYAQIRSKDEFMNTIQILHEPKTLDTFTKDHYDYDFEDDQSMPSEI